MEKTSSFCPMCLVVGDLDHYKSLDHEVAVIRRFQSTHPTAQVIAKQEVRQRNANKEFNQLWAGHFARIQRDFQLRIQIAELEEQLSQLRKELAS